MSALYHHRMISSPSMALRSSIHRSILPIIPSRSFHQYSPLSSSSSSSSSSIIRRPLSSRSFSSSSSPSPWSTLSLPSSLLPSLFRSLDSLLFSKAPKGFRQFLDDDDTDKNHDKKNKKETLGQEEDDKKSTEKKKNEEDGEKNEENTDKNKENTNKETNEKKSGEEEEGQKPFEFKFQFFTIDPKNTNTNKSSNSAVPNILHPLLILFLAAFAYQMFNFQPPSEITWQDFRIKFLETGRVHHLEVDPILKRVRIYIKSGMTLDGGMGGNEGVTTSSSSTTGGELTYYYFTIGSIDSFERQMEDAQRDIGIKSHDFIPIKYLSEHAWGIKDILSMGLTLTIIGLMIASFRSMSSMTGMGGMGGGKGGRSIFSVGKSPATVIQPGTSKITFADVAGLDEAKIEVKEFVEFLKNKEKFEKLGARIPKGALLVGPPGTGKTLLAKAVAGEASVPFFSIAGSDFLEMFVGVGPARVRDLFQQARASAPCIIFIDEIDAVGRERGKGKFSGGNDERENTLNQLLVEMDGFSSSEGVVVLAGTNRKDILDKALLRPGRFDRQITIDKPDIKGRTAIFKVHLKKIHTKMDRNELATRLAALTPGFTGADIANLCNEAAIIAARINRTSVELEDFEKASDRIIGGLEKKSLLVNQNERRVVAYHEAGHAVLGWMLEHANPVLKVTIVPRASGALGFAQSLPNELHLYHQQQLMDMMVMTLGGRAAEQIFFQRISTGAADDLQKVSQIAQAQVTKYGMSKKVGQLAFNDDAENQFHKPFSEATAQLIDSEVRELVNEAYERAIATLTEHRDKVEALAQKLLAVETVNHDMLVEVLGSRPYQTDAYLDYINEQKKSKLEAEAKKKKEEEAAAAKKAKQTKNPKETETKEAETATA